VIRTWLNVRTSLRVVVMALVITVASADAAAQETVVIGRMAAAEDVTFRYAQVFRQTGPWIAPDVGYIDFGTSDYREFFIGGGRTLVRKKSFGVIGEGYYLQAAGAAAASAKYVLPWVLVHGQFARRVQGEAVYFFYAPLNDAGVRQHVVERAKIEYVFDGVKLGAGYGAYQREGSDWQNRPFVTMTLMPQRIGAFELWLQHVPGEGLQGQIRYQLVVR
jgi:hypothetical protein